MSDTAHYAIVFTVARRDAISIDEARSIRRVFELLKNKDLEQMKSAQSKYPNDTIFAQVFEGTATEINDYRTKLSHRIRDILDENPEFTISVGYWNVTTDERTWRGKFHWIFLDGNAVTCNNALLRQLGVI